MVGTGNSIGSDPRIMSIHTKLRISAPNSSMGFGDMVMETATEIQGLLQSCKEDAAFAAQVGQYGRQQLNTATTVTQPNQFPVEILIDVIDWCVMGGIAVAIEALIPDAVWSPSTSQKPIQKIADRGVSAVRSAVLNREPKALQTFRTPDAETTQDTLDPVRGYRDNISQEMGSLGILHGLMLATVARRALIESIAQVGLYFSAPDAEPLLKS